LSNADKGAVGLILALELATLTTQGKDDNTDQTLLKGEWFRNVVIQGGEFWKEVEEAEEFIEEEVIRAVEQQEEG